MNCKDKVAIVTGAAGSGMGRSIALTLAREGARIVVNYLTSQDSANTIVEHIEQQGTPALAVQADIFTAGGCKQLVEAAIEHFGQVDICVVGPGGGWHPEPVDRLDPGGALEDLHRETAPIMYLMPLLLPGMVERNWGRFIAIAMHPAKLSPAYAYNLGKAARLQAMLLAYEQVWPGGVTMNVIAPGPVSAIGQFETAIEQCDHGAAWQQRANVSPQDIAEGVSFLCSESGKFISGCVLPYLFCG
ncbi:MAG: SDR family oxidoreductase [Anaerolineae bacterium]|nr:SDR family oxidoreductase [Anaerolineae bacterium]